MLDVPVAAAQLVELLFEGSPLSEKRMKYYCEPSPQIDERLDRLTELCFLRLNALV
jgi:hypothetical protein